METFFIKIFRFFKSKSAIFWLFFIGIFGLAAFLASNIHLEQDIYKVIPVDEELDKMSEVFKNQQSSNQIILSIRSEEATQEQLIDYAHELTDYYSHKGDEYIDSIQFNLVDFDESVVLNHVQKYLPLYLNDADYENIQSKLSSKEIENVLQSYQSILWTPIGGALGSIIEKDPLNITSLGLQKFQTLDMGSQFDQDQGYIFSNDFSTIHFFIYPHFKESDTKHQKKLVTLVEEGRKNLASKYNIDVEAFGSPIVATGNAIQMQKDTVLTLSLTLIALSLLIFYVFRTFKAAFFLLLPVVYGAVIGMACVYLIQGSLSIMALGAGAVILGVAVDFSVHFLSHFRYAESMEDHLRKLVKPLTLGAFTTVAAFFALRFAQAPILKDLGTFAAFSLMGASLSTLIFLPQIIYRFPIKKIVTKKKKFIDRIAKWKPEKYPILFWVVIITTPLFYFLSKDVGFDSDLMKLNYMSEELQVAQENINEASGWAMNNIYIVGEGDNMDEALQSFKSWEDAVYSDQIKDKVVSFLNPAILFPSQHEQRQKIDQWHQFWEQNDGERWTDTFRNVGMRLGYSSEAFNGWSETLHRSYQTFDEEGNLFVKQLMPHALFDKKEEGAMVLAQLKVSPSDRNEVFSFLKENNVNVTDRQALNESLLGKIHQDFDFVLGVASILVFLVLVLAYGRIELALITFIPLVITWVWILGIMTLLGIQFNIVNVMIATLIFGLGDDYSIFMMDALQEEYKTGKNKIQSSRTGVYLSVLTTIVGLGTLIFAQHPALKSIALISIIGLVCVLVISQIIQPVLFNWLIRNRAKKGFMPFTLWSLFKTLFAFLYFFIACVILIVLGIFLVAIPVLGRQRGKRTYHFLIHHFVRSLAGIMANVDIKIHGKSKIDWSQPSIVIANHSSFLDILLCIMLHPKVILMTNEWVWRSPVFGIIVRWADYFPAINNPLADLSHLEEKMEQGYHLVIFPEGTRTVVGCKIKRFHKGAFYLAEKLNLPIHYLFIQGARYGISKGDFLLKNAHINMSFLKMTEEGYTYDTYQEHAKVARRMYQAYSDKVYNSLPTYYFKEQLERAFTYKSPELEWYVRIKAKRENYYQTLNNYVPKEGLIYDLGAGYGLASYILSWSNAQRKLIAIDHDEDKIEVGKHVYTNAIEGVNNPICWKVKDLEQIELEPCEGIVILDTLHYFPTAVQWDILNKCMTALKPGGVLYYRDGMKDHPLHHNTIKTEEWSIKKLKFNRANYPIAFLSKKELVHWAEENNWSCEKIAEENNTSNTTFLISK